MDPLLVGFVISSVVALCLFFLFRIEDRRGVRYAPGLRAKFDESLVVLDGWRVRFFAIFHRDFVYQTIRFIYHGVLKTVLKALRFFEHRVQVSMRHNRFMAQRSERVRATRNKLDEIAEHKAAVALTEEEKKKRLHESLQ